jgi:hypothetical protein
MAFKRLSIVFFLALVAAAAQVALPDLHIEPTGGGSIFHIKNVASQTLTAYLIELVDYPGSSYAMWQDEASSEPIPPGGEKVIHITNMTVGAAPEYVKVQAALYADGTTSGIPAKVTQLVERRKGNLATTRELISRIEKAKSSGGPKDALLAELKQWADSLPQPARSNRNSQTAINDAAARSLIAATSEKIQAQSLDEVLSSLRESERALAAGKQA